MTQSEVSVAFIFLYDDTKLSADVIAVLNYIQNIEPISKIIISENSTQLMYNQKGVVIRPQDLPVFLTAKTGQETRVEPGTLDNAQKIVNVLRAMFGTK